jgi:lipopolysaccharide/colanic/teichoic acid biosynthesis glycosyltransferase
LNTVERKFILFLGDLLIILASLNVFINHAIDREFISFRTQLTLFLFGILVYFIVAYVLDFYNIQRTSGRRFIVSQSVYVTSIFVFSTFLFAVLLYDASFWRRPLLAFLVLTPAEIILWRVLIGRIFKIIPVIKNVLYLYDDQTEKYVKQDVEVINGVEMRTFYKVKLTCSISDYSTTKRSFLEAVEKVDAWIINTKNYHNFPRDLEKALIKSTILGKEVITFTTFYENIYEALPIRSYNDGFYEVLQLKNKKIRYLQKLFSFLINLWLSLIVGLLFIMVVPFVWLFNRFLNRGPLFYTQERVGQYGKEFKIYKFRSMVVNAEEDGAKMATANDDRITPFGRFLRVFRLDELPQVLSIIKGDMQFIGPRPERKVFVNQLNEIEPFYNVRHLIKPGITGWAQVKYKYGENLEDSIRKLEYDLYYIKNQSASLDLRIIFKTITTILFSRGI